MRVLALLMFVRAVFTLEEGYDYTEEQVAAAQEEIRQKIPIEIYRDIYEATPGRDELEFIRQRTPDYRQAMVEFARKMAYPLPGCVEHSWEEMLFLYRDEATVRKFVSKWFDEGNYDHYGRHLDRSADPEVVRLMGPFLFDKTPIPNVPEGSYDKGEWVASRLCRDRLIAACVEFPEEVRVWARRLGVISPPMKTQGAILQRWWKENEAAFEAREWNKVKPGVLEIPGMQKSLLVNPPVFEAAASQSPPPSAANPAVAIEESKPVTAARPASAGEPSTPSTAWLVTGAAVTIAALAGLLFFWKRRA